MLKSVSLISVNISWRDKHTVATSKPCLVASMYKLAEQQDKIITNLILIEIKLLFFF